MRQVKGRKKEPGNWLDHLDRCISTILSRRGRTRLALYLGSREDCGPSILNKSLTYVTNVITYKPSMRTSCRFAMAVHVMTVLAYKEGDRVTSALLASSVNTNPVIIRRLLLALQKAKLVDTCKGAGSGSRLNRSPGRINLCEIYRAVEDSEPFASPSRKPNAACPVGNCIRETLNSVFQSAQQAMEQDLERTTLSGILEMVRASCSPLERKVR